MRELMFSSDQVPILASAIEFLCANLLFTHSSSSAGWSLSHRLCLLTFLSLDISESLTYHVSSCNYSYSDINSSILFQLSIALCHL